MLTLKPKSLLGKVLHLYYLKCIIAFEGDMLRSRISKRREMLLDSPFMQSLYRFAFESPN